MFYLSILQVDYKKMTVPAKKYRVYIVRSWYWYQRVNSGDEHTIEKYCECCEKDAAELYEKDVMVLRDNVVKVNGYCYYTPGYAIQNSAETDGFVDVRTGKKYENIQSIFEDIQ